MERTITVKQYIGGEVPAGAKVYIDTFAGREEVTGIRWPESNPWIVCGRSNGGFGISYCVHYGTALVVITPDPAPAPTPSGNPAGKYCVIHRTGEPERFQWHRSTAMTAEDARARKEEMRRAGHYALTERYDLSVSVGLPDTYGLNIPA